MAQNTRDPSGARMSPWASSGALCPCGNLDDAWNPEGLAQVGRADSSPRIIGRAGSVLPVPLRHKLLSGQACGPGRLPGVTCNYLNGAGGRCCVWWAGGSPAPPHACKGRDKGLRLSQLILPGSLPERPQILFPPPSPSPGCSSLHSQPGHLPATALSGARAIGG